MKLSDFDLSWYSRCHYRFFTGSYTEEDLFPGSAGEGIQLWELDSKDGRIRWLSTCSEISNPSWVCIDPSGTRMAVASEHVGGGSRVCLLRIEHDGSISLVDAVRSGDATCHVGFSPDGERVASASYMSGEIQLMEVGQAGFAAASQNFQYEGSGPNVDRQEAPHAHQAVFSADGKHLYVPDLGSDRIWCHRIADGVLERPVHSLALPAGEGPRHLVMNKDGSAAWVLAELTGNIHSLIRNRTSGKLTYNNRISSLPDNWQKTPSAAAIRSHPQMPTLYVSHRNGGLISAFELNANSPYLELLGIVEVSDPSPRDFHISPDGRWLLVAGQETNRLYMHPIDPGTGKIGPEEFRTDCPTPVCIAWMPS